MNPKCLTLLVLPFLLTACRLDWNDGNQAPPADFVSEQALLDAIDLRPMPQPPLRKAFLGISGSLRGPAAQGFAAGTPVYLSARMPAYPTPPAPAGKITAQGRVEVRLPAQPDLSGVESLSAVEFARSYNTFTPCRLDTLRVEKGQEGVQFTPMTVFAKNPYVASAYVSGDYVAGTSEWKQITSPPPPYVAVLPFSALETQHVSERAGQLVYASGDVNVSGELWCVFKWVTRVQDATQYNLRVNLELKKGWNVIHRRFDGSLPSGVMPYHETVLTGDAELFTFTPD